MEKCIFCEIVGKSIPSFILYEDDDFVAFLDVNPQNKGHTLIVPKEHVRWVWEVRKFGSYFGVAKKITNACLKALDAKFVNIITAGLGVPHAHIHVIPRYENDGLPEFPVAGNVKKIEQEEMVVIAEKIRSAIPKKRSRTYRRKTPTAEKSTSSTRSEEDIEYMRREMES